MARVLSEILSCQDPSWPCSAFRGTADAAKPGNPSADQRGATSVRSLNDWKPLPYSPVSQYGIVTRYLQWDLPPATNVTGEQSIKKLKSLAIAALADDTQDNLLALMKGFREAEGILGGQDGLWDLSDDRLDKKIKANFDAHESRS